MVEPDTNAKAVGKTATWPEDRFGSEAEYRVDIDDEKFMTRSQDPDSLGANGNGQKRKSKKIAKVTTKKRPPAAATDTDGVDGRVGEGLARGTSESALRRLDVMAGYTDSLKETVEHVRREIALISTALREKQDAESDSGSPLLGAKGLSSEATTRFTSVNTEAFSESADNSAVDGSDWQKPQMNQMPLYVTVMGARALQTSEAGEIPPDVYCVIEVKDTSSKAWYHTPVSLKNYNPCWGYQAEVREYSHGDSLHFAVYKNNSDGMLLGRANLKGTFTRGFEGELPLQESPCGLGARLIVKILPRKRKTVTTPYDSIMVPDLRPIWKADRSTNSDRCLMVSSTIEEMHSLLPEQMGPRCMAGGRRQSLAGNSHGNSSRPSLKSMKIRSTAQLARNTHFATAGHSLSKIVDEPEEVEEHWLWKLILLKPISRVNMIWQLFGGILIAYDVIMIPMMMSFPMPKSDFLQSFAWLTTTYWTLDIPNTFRLAYEDVGVIEDRPRMIAMNYLSTWLIPDVAIVSLDWFLLLSGQEGGGSRSWRTAKVLRSCRVLRGAKAIRMVQDLMDGVQSVSLLCGIKIGITILLVLIMSHYLACYWYQISDLQFPDMLDFEPPRANWVQANGLEASIENDFEMAYSTVVTVVWFVVTAYFFSKFTVLALQMRDIYIGQETAEASIRRFLQENQVGGELGNSVVRFIRVNHGKFCTRMHTKNIPLFHDLPLHLRIELDKSIFQNVFRRHPLMSTFGLAVTNALSHIAFSEKASLAGEIVFNVNDESPGCYYISAGELRYYHPRRSDARIVRPDTWFLEMLLWRKWKCVGTLIARSGSELPMLDAKKFNEVMTEFDIRGWNMDNIRMFARRATAYFDKEKSDSDYWDKKSIVKIMLTCYPKEVVEQYEIAQRRSKNEHGNRLNAALGAWGTKLGNKMGAKDEPANNPDPQSSRSES